MEGALVEKLGDTRYVYTWAGDRVFKVVSFYLLRYASGRIGELARRSTRMRSPMCGGSHSRRRPGCSPTRASAIWPPGPSRP